jgi:hypothetical protein
MAEPNKKLNGVYNHEKFITHLNLLSCIVDRHLVN